MNQERLVRKETRVRKNEEVYRSWYSGMSCSNETKVLRTDGKTLYSYETIIAFTGRDTIKTALAFRWKGHRHMNYFTKKHVQELEGFLENNQLRHGSMFTPDFKKLGERVLHA